MNINAAQLDVAKFHHAGGQLVHSTPTVPPPDVGRLRQRLIREECDEVCTALDEGNLVQIADGIADAVYVLLGTAVSCGIDMAPVWQAVQQANMAKFPVCKDCAGSGYPPEADSMGHMIDVDGIWRNPDGKIVRECTACHGSGRIVLRDAGGKVCKPTGWKPPDIAAVLAAQLEAPIHDSETTARAALAAYAKEL